MFVISTRNFPPDVGGMQNLIGGLAKALVNHGPVTVFADKTEKQKSMIKFLKLRLKDLVDLNFLENTERQIGFLNLSKKIKI